MANGKRKVGAMGGKAIYYDPRKQTRKRGDVSVITPPKGKHFSTRAVSRRVRDSTDIDQVIRGLEREARIGMTPVSPHSTNTGKGKRFRLQTERGWNGKRSLKVRSKRTG